MWEKHIDKKVFDKRMEDLKRFDKMVPVIKTERLRSCLFDIETITREFVRNDVNVEELNTVIRVLRLAIKKYEAKQLEVNKIQYIEEWGED